MTDILALSYSFPPMAQPRAIQVSRLLGATVGRRAVICADDPEVRRDPSILPGGEGAFEKVIRLPMERQGLLARKLGGLGDLARLSWRHFPDRWRRWNRRAAAEFLAGRLGLPFPPRVLVTFGQPMSDHLFGLDCRRRTGLPWVAHFSDPWADNPYRRDNPLAAAVNRRMERAVIESADAVVFTCEEALDVVMGKYDPAWRGKASVLPHCFDPAAYPPAAPPAQGPYTLRVVGNFYAPRTAEPLLRGLETIARGEPALLEGVAVECAGFMGRQERERYPSARRVLRELGTVGYAESLRLMRTAHCLLVIDAPLAFSPFFPSKLADYLGAGAFVAALSPRGAAARIVGELGGPSADPADQASVAALLGDILRRRPDRLPRPAGAYGVDAAGRAFGGLLERVAAAPRPPGPAGGG